MRRLARAAAWGISAYQGLISPILPPTCRFAPSCSEYARQALLRHGVLRGFWLAVRRLVRCHPFHPGGYDPPPALHQGLVGRIQLQSHDTRSPSE